MISDFFTTISYAPELEDSTSWTAKAEKAADFLRAPGRWVAESLWKGGTVGYWAYENDSYSSNVDEFILNYPAVNSQVTLEKVIRFVIGIFLCLPGQLLAIPLMGFAYLNSEIRLKHHTSLDRDQEVILKQMIDARQSLANAKKGPKETL